jgi:thioredoxin-related protein
MKKLFLYLLFITISHITPAAIKWNALPLDPIINQAIKDKKPILVFFNAPWCGKCSNFKDEIFIRSDVKKQLQKYHLVSVNGDDEAEGTRLFHSYKCNTFPSFIFLNSKGVEFDRRKGPIPAKGFVDLLRLNLEQKAFSLKSMGDSPLMNLSAHCVKKNKPTIAIFYASWADAWKRMNKNVFSNPLIEEFLQYFEVIKVDAESREGRPWKHEYNVEKYPTFSFWMPEGHISNIEGYLSPKEFYRTLSFWYRKWRIYKKHQFKQDTPEAFYHQYGEEKRSYKDLKKEKGFMLKTGRIIKGVPVRLEDNIITFNHKKRITNLPLYLFTPKAKNVLREYMSKINSIKANLVTGEFDNHFKPIKSYMELTTIKNERKNTVIVLIDPEEKLHERIITSSKKDPRFEADLTWSEKYLFGKDTMQVVLNQLKTAYKVSFPAALIFGSSNQTQKISNIETPHKFHRMLKSFGIGAPQKNSK